MKMKDLFMLMGAVGATAGVNTPSILHSAFSKAEQEINEVCEWLKCSKDELYEKCKKNPNLLSRDANAVLSTIIKNRKKGGE